jgi:hypothetical protein
MLSVYKSEKILNEKVLGTYANHNTKVVFIKQFSKKCCLATGQMSQTTRKFVYTVGIDMSFEELENLTDALGNMSKLPHVVNYAEISETTDAQGNSYRLVLKRSEYDGLLVCKLKSSKILDSFAVIDEGIADPEPLSTDASQQPPADTREWTECFGKFYINKNDDWMRIRAALREFCVEVNHILNVDDASRIDVVPPSPPTSSSQQVELPSVEQVQRIKGSGKRVATETKGVEKKKKKKHQIIDDDEVI